MIASVECALAVQNQLGESPLWVPGEQALYWIDFCDHPGVFRWEPESRRVQFYPTPLAISALSRRKSGGMIAATRSGIAGWDALCGLTLLVNPEPDDPATRLNDAAVDRQGRFWVGSMNVGSGVGRLFRFNASGALDCMDTGFIVSNGIGWSPDARTMYFTDSFRHAIYAYDFEPASGAISNRRVFVDTTQEPGVPDGLTVDSQGGVWSAFCNGWKVARYTPQGRKDFEISLPVECPTSCTFGGPRLDTLYVTSSWGLVRSADRQAQPQAGNLFAIHTGFCGLPEPVFAG